MGKNSEVTNIGSFTKPTFDPLVLKAYSEALKQKQKWRTSIDRLIRGMLGLREDQPLNPGMIPSAEEIRREMDRYIPETEKLSDLIIATREE